ncbi:bacteriocin transporter [Streptococcus porcinus]|uniref:Thiol-disulfide isomerase and thioredoxin n=1 Tax=Streptococcus porcinus TaxID=1340 RepID=A0A4V0HGT7_STRPO|nr:bacteriocin transporter [Streptococcus porcinus]VTT46318.1 Thiol-disulfide isomerase and thioredoxin [Streptococcus porcinus]VTT47458.1 Thiol-disulfide isomerase and thioredoxin [Streptococcus porcinus]
MSKKLTVILLLSFLLLNSKVTRAESPPILAHNEAQAILTYKQSSHYFKHTSIAKLQIMMVKGDQFYLYTGRATCPHCRSFIPKLLQVTQHCKVPIYYLDSENTSLDLTLRHFRTHYGIMTVPNLSYFQSNHLIKSLDKPSQAQKEDIWHFLLQQKIR